MPPWTRASSCPSSRARSWPSWRPQLDDPDAFYALLGDGAWLESKASEGGTALARVREQLEQARAVLAG